jgi:hypothetical protein
VADNTQGVAAGATGASQATAAAGEEVVTATGEEEEPAAPAGEGLRGRDLHHSLQAVCGCRAQLCVQSAGLCDMEGCSVMCIWPADITAVLLCVSGK